MKKIKHPYGSTYAAAYHAPIDLRLSENPLGPAPKVIDAIIQASKKTHLYPDEEMRLVALLAERHGISKESILLGAGANELLEDILKVLALGKNIVVPEATFPESVACMTTLQGSATTVPLRQDWSLDLEAMLKACRSDTRLIHLCNPNNPTGIWTPLSEQLLLARRSPVPVLVCEAGADFVGETLIGPKQPRNLIVVRSFSKAHGLAGLRVGYAVAAPEMISTLKGNLRSYRVSSIAIAAAIAAIQEDKHLQRSIAYILREKAWLMAELGKLGFRTVPSQGQNFIAGVPAEYLSADHFCCKIEQYGAAVVSCSLYPGMENYIRISPQKRAINKQLIAILKLIRGK